MNIFGCANHSPDYLLVRLVGSGVEESDIAFISNAILKAKRKYKVYIFLSALDLRRNLKLLRKFPNCIGIVCAPPIHLNDFTGITPLDYAESDNPHLEAFLLSKLSLDLSAPSQEVKFRPTDYAKIVQDKVESFSGVLMPFMTFVYTMPSSTHQKPVKELACKWWVGGQSVKELEKSLAALVKTVPMNDKQRQRFLTIVTSQTGLLYQEALQEAKQFSIDSLEFRAVADRRTVSAYEMRYMISVVNSLNS